MRTTERPLLGDCGSNGSLIRRKYVSSWLIFCPKSAIGCESCVRVYGGSCAQPGRVPGGRHTVQAGVQGSE